MGAWGWGYVLPDGALGWDLDMAGFGVFYRPGFGVGGSSPEVPGHPTSICDAGIELW